MSPPKINVAGRLPESNASERTRLNAGNNLKINKKNDKANVSMFMV